MGMRIEFDESMTAEEREQATATLNDIVWTIGKGKKPKAAKAAQAEPEASAKEEAAVLPKRQIDWGFVTGTVIVIGVVAMLLR